MNASIVFLNKCFATVVKLVRAQHRAIKLFCGTDSVCFGDTQGNKKDVRD